MENFIKYVGNVVKYCMKNSHNPESDIYFIIENQIKCYDKRQLCYEILEYRHNIII